MAVKLDLRPAGAWQAEQDAKRTRAHLARTAPGPDIRRCCECCAPANFSTGDFGRDNDKREDWCTKHWHLAPKPQALTP